MAGYQRFTEIGTLVADPETRSFDSGKSVTKFRLAVNTRKNDTNPLFVNVVAWNAKGNLVTKLLKKGMQVLVESKLKIDEYTDKNGNKRRSPELSLNDFAILGEKNGNGKNDGCVVGNIVRAPETFRTAGGKVKTSLTLAIDSPKRKGVAGPTLFLNIVTWDNLAETCEKYCTKGQKLQFDGRLVHRQYDRKDGTGKGDVVELVAQRMSFVGSRKATTDAPQVENPVLNDEIDEEIPF